MVRRISLSYEEGRSAGDLGYSNLLLGDVVSKGSAFGAIYSSVEWLQHGLQKYVYTDTGNYTPLLMKQVEETDAAFLEWLYESLFSLSAFCYRKGNTEEQYGLMFPEEAYDFITKRIEYFKSLEEDKSLEFIQVRGTLNKLRLQTRDVERHFVAWFNEPVIVQEYRTHPGVYDNILRQQKFLNRLSTYFYWLTRFASIKSGSKHREWISRVPHFGIKYDKD